MRRLVLVVTLASLPPFAAGCANDATMPNSSGSHSTALRVQIAERSLFWSNAFWPVPRGLPLGQRSSPAMYRYPYK